MAIVGKVSEASKQKAAQHAAIKKAKKQSQGVVRKAKTSNSNNSNNLNNSNNSSGSGETTTPLYATKSSTSKNQPATKTPVSKTSSLYATPEAARVLADIKHKDAQKTKVSYGKYKSSTEVSETEYKDYQKHSKAGTTKDYYTKYRKPEPVSQTIKPTNKQAPAKLTKESEREFRAEQATIWKNKRIANPTEKQKKTDRANYFEIGSSLWKKVKRPDEYAKYRKESTGKPYGGKITENIFRGVSYVGKKTKETGQFIQRESKKIPQSSPITPVFGAAKPIGYSLESVGRKFEQKPRGTTTRAGITTVLGFGFGVVGGVVAKYAGPTIKAASVVGTSALTGVYGATQYVKYKIAPTKEKKQDIVGETLIDIGTLGVGAKVGSGLISAPKTAGTKTGNQQTTFKEPPKYKTYKKAPISNIKGKTTTKEFKTSDYSNARAEQFKDPSTGSKYYVYTAKIKGETQILTKKQFGKVQVKESVNKIKISGKKGSFGSRPKYETKPRETQKQVYKYQPKNQVTVRPKTEIKTFQPKKFNVGFVEGGSLVVTKPKTLIKSTTRGISTRSKSVGSNKQIVTRPKQNIVTKPKYNIIKTTSKDIITKPTQDIVTQPKRDLTIRRNIKSVRDPITQKPKPSRPSDPVFKIGGGFPLGFLKGIGSGSGGFGFGSTRKIGTQKKRYSAGAWESALGIKGKPKKGASFTGLGLRPIRI